MYNIISFTFFLTRIVDVCPSGFHLVKRRGASLLVLLAGHRLVTVVVLASLWSGALFFGMFFHRCVLFGGFEIVVLHVVSFRMCFHILSLSTDYVFYYSGQLFVCSCLLLQQEKHKLSVDLMFVVQLSYLSHRSRVHCVFMCSILLLAHPGVLLASFFLSFEFFRYCDGGGMGAGCVTDNLTTHLVILRKMYAVKSCPG